VRYTLFPGGARVRPRLCLSVALACGDTNPAAADAAATAIELLHNASLVHDDLPCFDDAGVRRGKLSVHAAFGEPIALLTGDVLIVMAFETVARECALTPDRIAPLMAIIGRAVGMPHGICAGQAWESEKDIPIEEYHRAKTASLFTGAACAGAVAAGSDPHPWLMVGEKLGAAYQVADDLRDVLSAREEIGKPAGQDAQRGRPNAVAKYGVSGAVEQLQSLVDAAIEAVPDCPGAGMLRDLIGGEVKRLVPKKLARSAA
jgi:geranylgeranyl diphosphate synthase type II